MDKHNSGYSDSKKCIYCNGKGWRYVRVAFTEIGGFHKCESCKGFGHVSMSDAEMYYDHQLKKDNY
jgi:hypothetical protein